MPVEDLVEDRGYSFDIGLDLAVDGESDRFGHTLARAGERRQPNQDASPEAIFAMTARRAEPG